VKQWEEASGKASLYKENESEMSGSVASSVQQTPLKQSFQYQEQPSTGKKQEVVEVGFDHLQDEHFKEELAAQILFVVPLEDLRLLAITSTGGVYACSFRNQHTQLYKKRILQAGSQITLARSGREVRQCQGRNPRRHRRRQSLTPPSPSSKSSGTATTSPPPPSSSSRNTSTPQRPVRLHRSHGHHLLPCRLQAVPLQNQLPKTQRPSRSSRTRKLKSPTKTRSRM